MPTAYRPNRGDIIWLSFQPQSGREQRGRRPALVLSHQSYNAKVGLAVVCPITSRIKSYPFEVALPARLKIEGAVLADQLRSLDWRARNATFIEKAPPQIVAQTIELIEALIT